MREELISVAIRVRWVLSAIGWAVVGAMIFAPLTLLAGAYYAILCAVLYGKVVLWGEITLQWGLIGIAAGSMLGFAGRLIDGENPLAPDPIRRSERQAAYESGRPTLTAVARDLVLHVVSVRHRT
jgi:hypothetical protein